MIKINNYAIIGKSAIPVYRVDKRAKAFGFCSLYTMKEYQVYFV